MRVSMIEENDATSRGRVRHNSHPGQSWLLFNGNFPLLITFGMVKGKVAQEPKWPIRPELSPVSVA